MNEDTAPNPLEEAITRVAEEPEGTDEASAVAARRGVLQTFATARVAVLLEAPVPPGAPPEMEKPLLFVTDGEDRKQPMLALFTRSEWAQEFHDREGGSFAHPAEVPAPWAVLRLPEAAGLMINPNRTPSFRIGPDVAGQMRDEIAQSIKGMRRSENPAAS
ncbi:MAG: SseB family protein [Gammaproteobacteria bacterium]